MAEICKENVCELFFRIVIRSSGLVKKSGTAGFSFWAGRDIICRSQFREKTQNKRERVEKQRNITKSIFAAYIRLNENQLNTKFHSTVCIKTTRKKLEFPLAFSLWLRYDMGVSTQEKRVLTRQVLYTTAARIFPRRNSILLEVINYETHSHGRSRTAETH